MKGKVVVILVLAATAILVTVGAWGQAPGLLPSCEYSFEARSLTARLNLTLAGVRFVVRQLNVNAEKENLRNAVDDSLKKSVEALSFIVGIRVQRPDVKVNPVVMRDITDFSKLSKLPGELQLELPYPDAGSVPPVLFFTSGEGKDLTVVHLKTSGDSVTESEGFTMSLARKVLGDGSVIILVTVSKWPEGDPKVSG